MSLDCLNNMYGYIYKTTNIVNNKIYIGQHRYSAFDETYIGSGTLLWKAINKYGRDNFICEMLEECNSFEELNVKENYYIQLYKSNNLEIGYNMTSGGQGTVDYKHTEVAKQKISKHNAKYWKNKNLSASTKLKLSTSHKGKTQSLEARINKANKLKGHAYWGPKEGYWKTHKFSDEHRLHIRLSLLGKSPANKGTRLTMEQKINVSIKTKEAMRRPEVQEKLRKRPRTDELKKKLSNAIKGRKFVTDGVVNKQVKPEEVEHYLSQGFKLGLTKGLHK